MKHLTAMLAIVVFALVFIQCAGNPEAEGDELYAQGKYKQAIAKYQQVKKSQPQNTTIKEKIALAYMQTGKQLFEKRKSIKAFIGNSDKAQEYLPEEGSPEFKNEYSKLLYQLAVAYNTVKPDNEVQKEQYFTSVLDNLEIALAYDENNTEADAMLSEIKAANFQKMYDKGMDFFKHAKKEKNNGNLYLNAEFYLKRAVLFDEDNKDARKQISLVRKNTLSIPNFNTDFPYAISDRQYKGAHLLIAFTSFNNIGIKMKFDPSKLLLVDIDENEYSIDKKQTAKFENGLTEVKTLKVDERIDCDFAYKISKSVKLSHMSYEMDNGVVVNKYFP